MIDREGVSIFLGYCSVGAWIGAQMPQVIENYRRGSVEGLALPFLISWFAGDFTNLVGCVLTHQLPFQIYLATYFIFVDLTLVSQYIYYSRKKPIHHIPPLVSSRRTSYLRNKSRTRKSRSLSRGYSRDEIDDEMAASWMTESSAAHTTPSLPSRSRQVSNEVMSASTYSLPPERGRSINRHVDFQDTAAVRGSSRGIRRNSSSSSRVPSTRRNTGLVFFSVATFLVFGGFRPGFSGDQNLEIRVWSSEVGGVDINVARRQIYGDGVSTIPAAPPTSIPSDWTPLESSEPEKPKRDIERFIGRVSAWLCTTLYLTSRLPQIWQNYRRKSVEGLSMMLFVMAFVGNSLYVISILVHPFVRKPGYLLEATPYLLGSGGTLCFDITIVLQSFLYDPKRNPSISREPSRRHLHRHTDDEEGRGLLEGSYSENEHESRMNKTLRGQSRSMSARRQLYEEGLSHHGISPVDEAGESSVTIRVGDNS